MLPRAFQLWPGLLALPLLLHCTPEGQALPPLQTVALDADPGELGPFEGRWFEALDGYLMAVVRGGERPRLSLRLSDTLHLEGASLQGRELLVRFRGEAGARAYSLLPVGANELVLVPPGGSPSWCGTCTPSLERNRSPLRAAGQRAARVVETVRVASDATWNWLVDTL
jgi:hypothetical protein